MDATTTPTVPVGPSEIAAALGALSSLLIALFGHDWGIGNAAQALAVVAVAVISVGTSIARAIKHHGLHAAQATVYVNQLAAAMQTAAHPAVEAKDVSTALETIQTGVTPEVTTSAGDNVDVAP